jgi:non-specific serine/threonine protein kinase
VARTIWKTWWFWWTRGFIKEGKLWADRCLEVRDLDLASRSHALAARAMMGVWSGEYELAVPAFREAADIGRETGDVEIVAYADIGVGIIQGLTRSIQEGADIIRRGVAALERAGDEGGATTGLAAVAWMQAITREFHDDEKTFVRTLRRAEGVGSAVELGTTEASLAQLRMTKGNPEGVKDLIAASLEHLADARHISSSILTLEVIAELGLTAGHAHEAVTILGSTAAIRSATGTRLPPKARARLDRMIQAGRDLLGHDFDGAFDRGSGIGFPEAIEHGRAVITRLRQGAGV